MKKIIKGSNKWIQTEQTETDVIARKIMDMMPIMQKTFLKDVYSGTRMMVPPAQFYILRMLHLHRRLPMSAIAEFTKSSRPQHHADHRADGNGGPGAQDGGRP